jgi:hypothetical protein
MTTIPPKPKTTTPLPGASSDGDWEDDDDWENGLEDKLAGHVAQVEIQKAEQAERELLKQIEAEALQSSSESTLKPIIEGIPELEEIKVIDFLAKGFWSWHPPKPPSYFYHSNTFAPTTASFKQGELKISQDAKKTHERTAPQIQNHIGTEPPPTIVEKKSVNYPKEYLELPDNITPNYTLRHPGTTEVFYAAHQKGLKLGDIDFCLAGGSALNFFARQGKFRIQFEKHTDWFGNLKNMTPWNTLASEWFYDGKTSTHDGKSEPCVKIRENIEEILEQQMKKQYIPASVLNMIGDSPDGFVMTTRGKLYSSKEELKGDWPCRDALKLELDIQQRFWDQNFVVQKVGNVIVAKHRGKDLDMNKSAFGFQFERLLTGKKMDGSDDFGLAAHKHLHVVQMGKYKVLLSAEVDAVDQKGNPVEIKQGNPDHFHQKVLWQMITSGSKTLALARKAKRGQKEVEKLKKWGKLSKRTSRFRITGHEIRSLKDVAEAARKQYNLKEAVDNIFSALGALKACETIGEEAYSFVHYDVKGQIEIGTPMGKTAVVPKKQLEKLGIV